MRRIRFLSCLQVVRIPVSPACQTPQSPTPSNPNPYCRTNRHILIPPHIAFPCRLPLAACPLVNGFDFHSCPGSACQLKMWGGAKPTSSHFHATRIPTETTRWRLEFIRKRRVPVAKRQRAATVGVGRQSHVTRQQANTKRRSMGASADCALRRVADSPRRSFFLTVAPTALAALPFSRGLLVLPNERRILAGSLRGLPTPRARL